jgi:YVTN family beta-propeller protein
MLSRWTTVAILVTVLTAGPASGQNPAPVAEPVGSKLIEIYRIVPGQHEAFLRAIAQFDEANQRGGVPPRQLYVHSDGASWDFLLIQDAEYPEGKGAAVSQAFKDMRLATGPRFFTEFRRFILEHTDTFVSGPTTAAAYLALLDATPRSANSPGFPSTFTLTSTLPLGGTPRWDYLRVNEATRRLYVAHDKTVDVIDMDTRQIVARVPGLAGAHGVALAPELDRGFVSSGDKNELVAFSLSTHRVVSQAKVGLDPDSATYEPASRRVFTWNSASKDTTVLDATTLRPITTIPVGGTPEFAVADGKGNVFVNIEESHEIVRIDAAAPKIAERWVLPGCEGPRALGYDAAHNHLLSACGNGVLLIVDGTTGRSIGSVKIGSGTDSIVVEPASSRAYVSSAEGFISIFDIDGSGGLLPVGEVQTRATGRTMAVDPRTGALFVPAADMDVDWETRTATFAPNGLKLYIFNPSR